MIKKWGLIFYFSLMLVMLSTSAFSARTDRGDGWGETSASNVESIANTRHNLTVSYATYNSFMDPYRSNYEAVCVYCHTPHGAASIEGAPLWNHTAPAANTFTLYDKPTSYGGVITNPGPNSLTCLSCHDGTIAIDSIINMPGTGKYLASQESSMNMEFLDQWGGGSGHASMGDPGGCLWCHYNGNGWPAVPSFENYVIGKDLRDDHPIGVSYPAAANSALDFNVPNAEKPGKFQFFDLDGDQLADSNEIRLYNSGDGFEVECASCHDPHGVMNPNTGTFVYAFLRQDNKRSEVCMSCHIK